MEFAKNLKKAREAAGYTSAKDFAASIGVGYTTYMGYENKGYEPKYEILCRIAEKLGASVDSLLGYGVDDIAQAVNACQAAGFRVEKDDGGYSIYDNAKKGNEPFGPYAPAALVALVSKALNRPELKQAEKSARFQALWTEFVVSDFF